MQNYCAELNSTQHNYTATKKLLKMHLIDSFGCSLIIFLPQLIDGMAWFIIYIYMRLQLSTDTNFSCEKYSIGIFIIFIDKSHIHTETDRWRGINDYVWMME